MKCITHLLLFVFVVFAASAHVQQASTQIPAKQQQSNNKKMKVDIWSDVMCPFCYIGKRKFEDALAQFANRDDIEIEWHSFQLDPDVTPQPGRDVYSYLAERKGISDAQSRQMHDNVVAMAKQVGLQYNFDKAVIANSFDAHRIGHLAKKYGKGDAMEEQLFRGYFTEGKDIASHDVLVAMAKAIGIDEAEARQVLNSNMYADAVAADIQRAAQIGVRGVPFFVLNNKYAVSGAQQPETFLQALSQAWKEYEKDNPKLTIVGGDATVCEPGGECK
jgi:predicted DsbA family dithiol-disulfide isomerase